MSKGLLRLRSLEAEHTLEPGGTLRLGRHRSNEVVLQDPLASRFHARITWPEGSECPAVEDLKSQNGTFLDERRITRARLETGQLLGVGERSFRVELEGCPRPPALLDDDENAVLLFSESGTELSGAFRRPAELPTFLLRMEAERRTGTLQIELSDACAELVFCLGRIMSAACGRQRDREALGRVLHGGARGYRFRREFDVGEGSLNLWPSDLIARLPRALRNSDPTMAPTRRKPRDPAATPRG